MVCGMSTLGVVIAEREYNEDQEGSSGASNPCRGRGCCGVGAAVLAFSFVPLAPPSSSTSSRLWLQRGGNKNT